MTDAPCQIIQNRAFWSFVASAAHHQIRKSLLHALKRRDLLLDGFEVNLSDPLHIIARPLFVLPQSKQRATVFDGESKCACPAKECQLVQFRRTESTIAVAVPWGRDEPDIFIVPDRFGREMGLVGGSSDIHVDVL